MKKGIDICLNLVIPSMFIFMIFSNIIMKTKLSFFLSFLLTPLAKVLKLNKTELSIFILSLLGGYPIGAKLLSDENISPQKASKMLAFCVNCGPAFLITGLGSRIFFNSRVGVYIYFAQIFSAILIAFIMSFFYEETSFCKENANSKTPLSVLVVNSVNDSIKSMALICGFIVAFSGIIPIINILLPQFIDKMLINGLLEMTIGCNSLTPMLFDNYNKAILLAAFYTSFGGVCVILQITCLIKRKPLKSSVNNKKKYINMTYYVVTRPFYIAFTMFFTWCFLHFAPIPVPYDKIEQTISTFKKAFESKIYSVTPISTLFLLLLSLMLLFFSRKSDKMKKG